MGVVLVREFRRMAAAAAAFDSEICATRRQSIYIYVFLYFLYFV